MDTYTVSTTAGNHAAKNAVVQRFACTRKGNHAAKNAVVRRFVCIRKENHAAKTAVVQKCASTIAGKTGVKTVAGNE
jgi:hypothetical protein